LWTLGCAPGERPIHGTDQPVAQAASDDGEWVAVAVLARRSYGLGELLLEAGHAERLARETERR
jgi:hypothetical protein